MINFFLDLETIPDQRPLALEKLRADVTAPGQYKKPESIDKWLADNAQSAAEEKHHKTSLNGIAGEICSIAWAFDDGEIQGLFRPPDITERQFLETFFETIYGETTATMKPGEGTPMLQWIGHNLIDFDLRFLLHRSLINNVRPMFTLPVDARHGQGKVFDTMKEWAGWKGFVSQNALREAFGIKGKSDMDGSMVWQAYQDGKFEEILEYNKDDVRIVREIYNRMTWQT